AYIWFLSAVFIGGVCIGVGAGEPFWVFDLFEDISEIISESSGFEEKIFDVQFLKIIIISIVLAPFFIMTHSYFCFAIGNLSNSRKLGVAVLTFFGVNIAENIVTTIILSFVAPHFVDDRWATEAMPMDELFQLTNKIMILALIISVVISVGFFIAAERIFAKKLNLE
ncbi:MAG: hypothetical protein K2N60_08975, partial [Oscillospiraceae bacterium]|nr:hypothetical protein [Oscillospiraceae bacterium]